MRGELLILGVGSFIMRLEFGYEGVIRNSKYNKNDRR